jgi:hypothetical protein
MKISAFGWTAHSLAVLALTASIGALAQSSTPTRFSGVIDSFTPQMTNASTGAVSGPYEVHGTWYLQLLGASGSANFEAALDMELSDGWAATANSGTLADESARDRHTHHITVINGMVTMLANGFQVTGPATITLNGNSAPINPSPVTITITGGGLVQYSNVTVALGGKAANHFGKDSSGNPVPLVGVVQNFQ